MYKYTRLPIGIKCFSEISQVAMENFLCGIEECYVYNDDVGIFTNIWVYHIKYFDVILQQSREKSVTINQLKCEWTVKETDCLGYWIKPIGLKPWR